MRVRGFQIIFVVERHLRDAIAAIVQRFADITAFFDGVAFAKIRIAQPTPVTGRIEQFQHGLVFAQVNKKLFRRGFVQIDVGVRVVADELSASHPSPKRCGCVVGTFEFFRVDEAVDRRQSVFLQDRQHVGDDAFARHVWREFAVERQVVERDGDGFRDRAHRHEQTSGNDQPPRVAAPHLAFSV